MVTTFLRLLADPDKAGNLLASCISLRLGVDDERVFEVEPSAFKKVPGAPFAYWASEKVRSVFKTIPAFESSGRSARQGLATAEDFRFLRLSWEVKEGVERWVGFAKGGSYTPFYADIYLCVNWMNGGAELRVFAGSVIRNPDYYLRPGITWSLRTKSRLSMRALPKDCIYSHKGPAAFLECDASEEILALISISSSSSFYSLVELQLAAADLRAGGAAHSFEVGVIQKTPAPYLGNEEKVLLAALARRAWSLRRTLDTIEETSHAFHLPAALRSRLGDYDPPAIDVELSGLQAEIDAIAFDLYGFDEADRAAALRSAGMVDEDVSDGAEAPDDSEDNGSATPLDQTAGLLSWAVGVAFGRFDWRLATGERAPPPEPEPFDPLPAKSPGMLPDGAASFHSHVGILVDDQGHPHDLLRLSEEVLARVDAPVPADIRSWLQRDFFPLHLKQYSKSRRKAPIYWPLSTASGDYTLWLYYPSLTAQTLYTAVNDFIEGPNGKLSQVRRDIASLRDKGSARSRDDDRVLETLQSLELELSELRDLVLQIAPTYCPNHDDGVQITAAPLWELFRNKPLQKVLKETWAKLKKGDYDWAHLAMAYWPERVREKCKTDKSLAIAHDLEHLYVEPKPKARGKKNINS